jgi:hypothetical protein
MPKLSGATQQSLALLIDKAATHSVIESLYLRFDVEPFPPDASPNKLKKATRLVQVLSTRSAGPTTLMSLINYLGYGTLGIPDFKRGSPLSEDFYRQLDQDLESSGQVAAEPLSPRTFWVCCTDG